MTTTTETSSPWTVDAATAAATRNLREYSAKGNDTIGVAGFLTLMTAQMQYQDPFSPMDNNQMVAQMAQFSQLASSNDANTLLSSIADSLSGSRLSDAASWIGKSMLVKSNIAAPDRYGQYAGELTRAADADAVSVDLIDGSGAVVASMDLGAQKAGTVPFYWDGTDADGNSLDMGNLQVKVRGATPAQISTWASIAAVQSPAGGSDTKLITPLGNYAPTDALRLG